MLPQSLKDVTICAHNLPDSMRLSNRSWHYTYILSLLLGLEGDVLMVGRGNCQRFLDFVALALPELLALDVLSFGVKPVGRGTPTVGGKDIR